MISLPYIPSHVVYCHKNYYLAQELLIKEMGETPIRPWTQTQKEWGFAQKYYAQFREEVKSPSNGWQLIEEFFVWLINKEEDDDDQTEDDDDDDDEDWSEGSPLMVSMLKALMQSLILKDDTSESKLSKDEKLAVKELLNLSFEQAMSKKRDEAVPNIQKIMEHVPLDDIRKISDLVDAAISAAMTRRGAVLDTDTRDFNRIDIAEAGIRDFASINETVFLTPELRKLAMYNLISGNLTTMTSVVHAPKKLYVLLDDSGSMSNTYKLAIVYMVLMRIQKRTRTQGIEAKLFFFEDGLQGKIYDLAKELPENDCHFNGGYTDIQQSLTELSAAIQGQTSNASILIINDGDDRVDDGFHPALRTVALTLFRENKGLKAACKCSKGEYFHLKYWGSQQK